MEYVCVSIFKICFIYVTSSSFRNNGYIDCDWRAGNTHSIRYLNKENAKITLDTMKQVYKCRKLK